jgi:hypothetical protein
MAVSFTKRVDLAHSNVLTPPLFIEVPVPSKKSEWIYLWVFFALSTNFAIEF